MGLKGGAFLAIWHDIAEGAHENYIEWHTREHMPERLSIPGFRTGKRLHDPDAARYVFGTIYAGEDVEVFRSPAYLERLNNPTPWTSDVAPSFQNFLRIACRRIAHAGLGDGGAMATIRFAFSGVGGESGLEQGAAQPLVDAILSLPGVAAVHLGVARAEVSSVRTRETEIRSEMAEKGFDAVLLVEGSSRPGLVASVGRARDLALQTGLLTGAEINLYDVAFTLTSEDMEGAA
ncbi:hypothetical protein ACHFJ0_18670 [Paracoccus sp. NGMCC 1.201697]|uniref:Uncharacterized protein n=1 Tax=Paracoccus broussonetiae subsp. drimophilus TaxID=3373869 RepID=A0ABW7LT30_9RHOB